MALIDGKKIAAWWSEYLLNHRPKLWPPRLILVKVGDDLVMDKYINQKQKIGRQLGVVVDINQYPVDISQTDFIAKIKQLRDDFSVQGIVIQLPLPAGLDAASIIASLNPVKDPDALHPNTLVESPVVRAVKEVFRFSNITLTGKNIVVIGRGRLVGQPIRHWLKSAGYQVTVVDKTTTDLATITGQADIIISGAGQPGLIKPSMVKTGVVLIDAGTSESGGRLCGDIDPACFDKAALATPVPGGIGPIAVMMLFVNLWFLTDHQRLDY